MKSHAKGDPAAHPRFADDPSDVATLATTTSPAPVRADVFVLRVDPSGETHRISGEAAKLLIGSGPACEVRLPDARVSRRHASVEIVAGRLVVTDLQSTNGTWLGLVRVFEVALAGGETLQLGGTRIHVERGAGPAPAPLPNTSAFGRALGQSAAMRRLFPLLQRLAESSVPVVIEGETGTGKEVVAESIHAEGPRRDRPFVVFDCTTVPPNLLEAELFGFERGAFTGANASRRGLFEQADGGTLFIDEIGDLDLTMQPKLLRALERSEVRRLGGEKWLKVDVRLLAATRRDLDREVQAGRFRDDLFHRLAVARIELPPLRKRAGDIPLLVAHFCRESGADPSVVPAPLLAAWADAAWAGNVRELRNVVARHVALGELAELARGADTELPPGEPSADWLDAILGQRLPLSEAREAVLAEFEARYVTSMLEATGGNVVRAAARAGVARRYFQILRAKRVAPGR